MYNMLLPVLVFFPFIAGLAVYVCGRNEKRTMLRNILAMICTVAEFVMVWAVCFAKDAVLQMEIPEICGFGLNFTMDGFRWIYAGVLSLMWLMTTCLSGQYFTGHHRVTRFYFFLLWTLGATMGVFLSADLYTTFIFFEIMSFTSYAWVAQEENRASLRAAETYLFVAVIGGLVMLMGIFLLYHEVGTLNISELRNAAQMCEHRGILYVAACCMLVGFGAKAGAFPLHIWLPKAHPVAPAPASALLSGALTKTGIYGILLLSCNLFLWDQTWGKIILTIGVITMFGGAVLAVFSIDLKRTLACSSMSQIGFIMVGIGMQGLLGEENALAVHGTFLHMVNHSLIKLVLFMAAGVIYMNVHKLDLNDIRGYGRKKPVLAAVFLVGALAIGGIPMFGGYVSKTLLHESIVEYGGGAAMTAVEWIFLFSGGLTVAYMTKLFIAVFVEKNQDDDVQKKYDEQRKYWNPVSAFALTVSALILLVWGILPQFTMNPAAAKAQDFMGLSEYGAGVHYFSLGNLKGALISILIGVLVYLLFIRKCLMKKEGEKTCYVNAWPAWLDLENLLYRPLLVCILPAIFGFLCRIFDCMLDTAVVLLRKSMYKDSPLPHERVEGNLLTELVGKVMNAIEEFGNHHWNKQHEHHVDYVHLNAMKNEQFKINNSIISRSLSFGLLMFGIGVILTLVYLVCW